MYVSNVKSDKNSYSFEAKLPVQGFTYEANIEVETKPLINFIKTVHHKFTDVHITRRGIDYDLYLKLYAGNSDKKISLKEVNNDIKEIKQDENTESQ